MPSSRCLMPLLVLVGLFLARQASGYVRWSSGEIDLAVEEARACTLVFQSSAGLPASWRLAWVSSLPSRRFADERKAGGV
jgi:hypothetical protein